MVIRQKTRLTPVQRQEIYHAYHTEKKKVAERAREYHASRPTIYQDTCPWSAQRFSDSPQHQQAVSVSAVWDQAAGKGRGQA